MLPELALKLVAIFEAYFNRDELRDLAALFDVRLATLDEYEPRWLSIAGELTANLERGNARRLLDKEGKNAIKWTRLSCTTFRANAVRLQLHALAYNLANFLRTLALPGEVERWSLTTLREKVVKIGARSWPTAVYLVFQVAEVAVPRQPVGRILDRIAS